MMLTLVDRATGLETKSRKHPLGSLRLITNPPASLPGFSTQCNANAGLLLSTAGLGFKVKAPLLVAHAQALWGWIESGAFALTHDAALGHTERRAH
jgi:hypothetical protein